MNKKRTTTFITIDQSLLDKDKPSLQETLDELRSFNEEVNDNSLSNDELLMMSDLYDY